MEERKHWNRIGSSYQEEIFDVFRSDRNKLLPKILGKYYNNDHLAIDFGCGTGRAFEYLAPNFRSVLGVDISDNLLAIAKKTAFTNIKLKQHDLTKTLRSTAEFGFCCNVVMLPEVNLNKAMFRNIRKSIRKGGNLVIILPSLDSFIYSTQRQLEWCEKDGSEPDLAGFKGSKSDLVEGIVRIDGVKTKHYLEPELKLLLTNARFGDVVINKLEYDWTSEFSSPPKWMKAPYPWDWIVEARAV